MSMKRCKGCGEIGELYIIPNEPEFCGRCLEISHDILSQNLPMTTGDLIAQVQLAVEALRKQGQW